MAPGEITDSGYWDAYWDEQLNSLPIEASHGRPGLQMRRILAIFDQYVPRPLGAALEVGGAPGQYLAYVHKETGCECAILDYSPLGCELTRRNFGLLGIPISVYERDLLAADTTDIGTFDLVFSLGLVEHFEDPEHAASAQLHLVRPGGTLLLGMPNLRGVNGWLAKRVNPARYAAHNTDAMRLFMWEQFERRFRLERLFLGYVGGFEPGAFSVPGEGGNPFLTWAAWKLHRRLSYQLSFVRRFNHRAVSGYLIGAWRLPAVSG